LEIFDPGVVYVNKERNSTVGNAADELLDFMIIRRKNENLLAVDLALMNGHQKVSDLIQVDKL